MPIHDWTRLETGDFHHFHQTWTPLLAAALNAGILPPPFLALTEQVTGKPIPDVVTLQNTNRKGEAKPLAVKELPTARVVARNERSAYARKKNRIAIRHGRGRVVAIIEIVSPGNKDSRNALRTFVEKAVDILNQGVHLLVVDLFPPTVRDPQGIHKAIWDEFGEEPFPFLPEKPFTFASYFGGEVPTAFVETAGLGDELPSMPIFLGDAPEIYVAAPLEASYLQAWSMLPALLREELG